MVSLIILTIVMIIIMMLTNRVYMQCSSYRSSNWQTDRWSLKGKMIDRLLVNCWVDE